MSARWTPEELAIIAAIVSDPNVELAQQKLVERFGGPQGQTTGRLLEAAMAADTLRAGGTLDLGDGTTFGRLVEAVEPRPDLERFIGQLASLESASTADRMLAAAAAELGIDHLLGPCQRLLDKLRDEYHAGPDREAEPIAGDVWRVGGDVVRLCESAHSMHRAAPARLRASLTGCVRASRGLYVEASLASMPQRLGEVAAEIAMQRPLVLSATPGRLRLDGLAWPMRPGLPGRTALDVHLADALGQPAGVGVLVEVAHPGDVEALAHELIHAGGGHSEDLALRLGHDLARWATASSW